MATADDLCWMPASEMAPAIKRRKLSPVEVMKAVLARIERLNPRLNAFVTLTADQALKDARAAERAVMKKGAKLGPLHGVPFSTKDLVITKGIRTTFGTRLFADNVPAEDAPMVERMRAAGAIQLGKTNTPMMGWIGATHNLLFGITRNPWNLDRTPGGSSGGASAAVAAGMGPLAIGTDGGGLDPHPGLAGRHLRHQAHVRPRADLSVQRRVGPLAHRPDDPHGGGRRADAERGRGPRRPRSLLAAGPARGLREGPQGGREGAAGGVDRRSRASPRRWTPR